VNTIRKRVLVVEDNVPLLRAVSLCLQRAGYDVMPARDGEEGFVRIAEALPDVIVSDIMMPGMDGYALAEEIRRNPRTDLLPIIFLTARDSRADRIRGFRAGVDAYLVKPFEPEELVAALQNILDRVQRTHTRVARSTHGQVGKNEAEAQHAPAERAAPEEGLTDAEMRVAQAVAHGLSNKDIAGKLTISVRTVEMHISHILQKKNWSNRVEIARHMIEREKPP
jgi:DNA-binding NarL/FixJ family response regulator